MPDSIRTVAFDRPVAVIGDIHGRSDLLNAMLSRLPPDMPILVTGDVGDRGPDTKGVIERLIKANAIGAVGNHDEWFIRWTTTGVFDTLALAPIMGGFATLRSYGGQDLSRIPPDHVKWLRSLTYAIDLSVMGHPFWLTHAGVPTTLDTDAFVKTEDIVPWLAKYQTSALTWASNDPTCMMPCGRPLIMGHRVHTTPRNYGDVIAIDTGCGTVRNGYLSAVILPSRKFISVQP